MIVRYGPWLESKRSAEVIIGRPAMAQTGRISPRTARTSSAAACAPHSFRSVCGHVRYAVTMSTASSILRRDVRVVIEADRDRHAGADALAQRLQQQALGVVVRPRDRRAVQREVDAASSSLQASSRWPSTASTTSSATGGAGLDPAATAGTIRHPAASSTSHAPVSSLAGPSTSRCISAPTANVCRRKSSSVVSASTNEFDSIEK